MGCVVTHEVAALVDASRLEPGRFSALWARERLGENPFAVLASIVLSQNTSDANAIKAFESLSSSGLLSPEAIAEADTGYLAELVKPAGQQTLRARALKSLANAFLTELGGTALLCRDCEATRERLLRVWGIGKKTADVFLSFYCGCRTVFPVDRHIARITERLTGMRKLTYDTISAFWLECLREAGIGDPYRLHIALIEVGRKVCRPKTPLCWRCVFRERCLTAKDLSKKR